MTKCLWACDVTANCVVVVKIPSGSTVPGMAERMIATFAPEVTVRALKSAF